MSSIQTVSIFRLQSRNVIIIGAKSYEFSKKLFESKLISICIKLNVIYWFNCRCWWIIAFGLSLFCCGISMRTVFTKWIDNPVTITYDKEADSILSLPFPTITICPKTKTSKDKLDLFAVYHEIITSHHMKNLNDLQ